LSDVGGNANATLKAKANSLLRFSPKLRVEAIEGAPLRIERDMVITR